MTYVIAQPCVDIKDKACIEECPVDCIYEGERKLYINPFECIDCGNCEPACPVEAITQDRRVPEEFSAFAEDNKRFFTEALPFGSTVYDARRSHPFEFNRTVLARVGLVGS